jgi:C4-dicarboxylate-specific signal transduction histidine kinase
VITKLHDQYRLRIEQYQVQMNWDLQTEAWLPIDAIHLERILGILIDNSLDAVLTSGGLRKISLSLILTADHVKLQIVDSGPGPHPEIKDNLFKPFVTSKGLASGGGLSLTLAKHLAEKNGGTLRYRSEIDKTCFELEVRVLKTDERLSRVG